MNVNSSLDASHNLLHLLRLTLQTQEFSPEDERLASLTQALRQVEPEAAPITAADLVPAIQAVLRLNSQHPAIFEFLQACVPYFEQAQSLFRLVDLLVEHANQCYQISRLDIAIHLAKFCVQIAPEDVLSVKAMTFFLQNGGGTGFAESIPWAEQWLARADYLADRVLATHYLLSGLMQSCANWQRACAAYQSYKSLLAELSAESEQPKPDEQPNRLHRLLAMGMFLHYFEDNPDENRLIRNRVAEICQAKYRSSVGQLGDLYSETDRSRHPRPAGDRLKIGYISDCLRQHSVGWLARWLLSYHDAQQFEVHLYATGQSNDSLQQAFRAEYGDRFHLCLSDAPEIAQQIRQDAIDILVDLDSLTFSKTCSVMALKPTPVQVSWLGFDASGLPAVDYFLADPYVLPDDAQDYYSEKIWRLPQTYIAVDGFEVGTATLRRSDLGIPEDAIVYLSAQSGLKRNPENIRLQMQILRAVPNSYFLIKTRTASDNIRDFFGQLAESEGVSVDRLRFLPDEPSELTHRANLSLADVVLDTYPYTGATTTLEALWMGLPIVTRVGQQFAARNSYTMLKNVGIQEGIAWSDAEYLEWGIRLGQDAPLRQRIAYRLRQSRHTASLWNTQQFAREVEQAYRQMWQQYLAEKAAESGMQPPQKQPCSSPADRQTYIQQIARYQQQIEANPTQVEPYWRLGLALLLNGQEDEAQVAWMTPLLEAEPEQADLWLADLVALLAAEADRQTEQSAETAWVLRQHIQEFAPQNFANLLRLVPLSLKMGANLDELLPQLTEALQNAGADLELAEEDLFACMPSLLQAQPDSPETIAFLEACIPHIADRQRLLHSWLLQAQALDQSDRSTAAATLGRLCLQLAPVEMKVLLSIVSWMQHAGDTENLLQSIPLAEQCLAQSTHYSDRLAATHLLLSALMSTCGSWSAAWQVYQTHKQLLAQLPELAATDSAQFDASDRQALPSLIAMGAFLLYFEDQPQQNRPIRNQFAALCQAQIQRQIQAQTPAQQGKSYTRQIVHSATKPLKIGYLSECLRQHSIGWLVRWLLKYHDRQQFDVHLYSLMQAEDRIQTRLQQDYGDRFHALPSVPAAIAERIYDDEIDILIELDSLTSISSCAAAALKPAPIQVNWLGYDAAGLPAIDYFLADPYVLPDDAQACYSEKIWRLPQTYIAVDGFEVGIASLRRSDLDIPENAIVYLSSQSGLKRNPNNIRLQMQILRAVPNSYFLIKSWRARKDQLEELFGQLADEAGVSRDRLRFLPGVPSELIHRANLSLADVVLDTYPYNGATTTLEALWMGLPIVTRVGQQFAARNSYTMLKNAGIQEGIAWSDAEYLEWGIRLGQDAALRERIFYQLRQSRHNSPLWNAERFTREVEAAYRQMWQRT